MPVRLRRHIEGMSRRKKPSSPCIKICIADPDTGLCRGCLRTLDEIVRWGSMSETERLTIMAELPKRQVVQSSEDPAAG